MIRCTRDMTIPEDNECAYCCIHCKDNESCVYYCEKLKTYKDEETVEKYCDECA